MSLIDIAKKLHPANPVAQLEFLGDVISGVTSACVMSYANDPGSVAIVGLNATGRILATLNRAIEIKAAELEAPREPRRVQ